MTTINRRQTLKLLGVSGAGALVACAPKTLTPSAATKVATLKDFEAPGATVNATVQDVPIVLVRLEGQTLQSASNGAVHVTALSRVCTHLGCEVNTSANKTLDCGCHGSSFDLRTGAVLRGPAGTPLQVLKLEWRGEDLFLV